MRLRPWSPALRSRFGVDGTPRCGLRRDSPALVNERAGVARSRLGALHVAGRKDRDSAARPGVRPSTKLPCNVRPTDFVGGIMPGAATSGPVLGAFEFPGGRQRGKCGLFKRCDRDKLFALIPDHRRIRGLTVASAGPFTLERATDDFAKTPTLPGRSFPTSGKGQPWRLGSGHRRCHLVIPGNSRRRRSAGDEHARHSLGAGDRFLAISLLRRGDATPGVNTNGIPGADPTAGSRGI